MKKKNKLESNDLNTSKAPDVLYKWGWPAHASVAEVVYNKLQVDIRENLILEKMKDGSNDPDEKFKDTALHHYPPSYTKASTWLEQGKVNYHQKDYEYASYCLGVATHYISDTFSAPHCVSHEKSTDHHDFEVQANDLTPIAGYVSGDLDTLMKKGVEKGKADWEKWLKTRDRSAAQEEVNMAASVAYSVIKDSLS